MQVGKVYNRKKIMELPYKEFMQGRRWTPRESNLAEDSPPLLWTTVVLPEPLSQIESKEEYLLLLTRRVEWLIEGAISDWLISYEPQEELEAQWRIAQEINQYLPMYLEDRSRRESPHQMASYLVMNYQELQDAALEEQQFPVTPHPAMETGLDYLENMNLMDWLMWMNVEANPHYFQD